MHMFLAFFAGDIPFLDGDIGGIGGGQIDNAQSR